MLVRSDILKEDGHVSIRALVFAVEGQRKKEGLKRTWEKLAVKESVSIEDVLCRTEWIFGVNQNANGFR